MFLALSWGVNYVCSLFPNAMDELVMIDIAGVEGTPSDESLSAILVPSLLPTLGVSAAVIVASLFSSAELLRRRVSL